MFATVHPHLIIHPRDAFRVQLVVFNQLNKIGGRNSLVPQENDFIHEQEWPHTVQLQTKENSEVSAQDPEKNMAKKKEICLSAFVEHESARRLLVQSPCHQSPVAAHTAITSKNARKMNKKAIPPAK